MRAWISSHSYNTHTGLNKSHAEWLREVLVIFYKHFVQILAFVIIHKLVMIENIGQAFKGRKMVIILETHMYIILSYHSRGLIRWSLIFLHKKYDIIPINFINKNVCWWKINIIASSVSNFKLARTWLLIKFCSEKSLSHIVVLEGITSTLYQSFCKPSKDCRLGRDLGFGENTLDSTKVGKSSMEDFLSAPTSCRI